MKNLLISGLVAAVVSLVVVALRDQQEIAVEQPVPMDGDNVATSTVGPVLSYTDALIEDTWVNAGRTVGSDRRTLTSASSSVCYLTKVQISGIQTPDDSNTCAIEIDDFTGFWQLIATADEGSQSEVRCNARCLTWESD